VPELNPGWDGRAHRVRLNDEQIRAGEGEAAPNRFASGRVERAVIWLDEWQK
jgi:hypothetical protein